MTEEAGVGHNSGDVSSEKLKYLISQIESAEERRKAEAEAIKDVYAVAKSNGYDVKIIRQIIRLRRIDEQKRREDSEVLSLYMSAIGMIN